MTQIDLFLHHIVNIDSAQEIGCIFKIWFFLPKCPTFIVHILFCCSCRWLVFFIIRIIIIKNCFLINWYQCSIFLPFIFINRMFHLNFSSTPWIEQNINSKEFFFLLFFYGISWSKTWMCFTKFTVLPKNHDQLRSADFCYELLSADFSK